MYGGETTYNPYSSKFQNIDRFNATESRIQSEKNKSIMKTMDPLTARNSLENSVRTLCELHIRNMLGESLTGGPWILKEDCNE